MGIQVKREILEKLKSDTGSYISGEALSEELGVSRTAVWKHIRQLKEEGYCIEASSKKGYRLAVPVDILNSHEISYGLQTEFIGNRVEFFSEIDSTNTYAKKVAYEGCPEGTVIVADRQLSGKGRLGRSWDSADKKGIWMSVVLRPAIPPEDIQIITLAASTAVANAIRRATGVSVSIKWPNDIVLEGKKLCGILAEMSSEADRINFIVLGIGINVSHEEDDFGEEIRNSATSLKIYLNKHYKKDKSIICPEKLSRSEIIKNILAELEGVYYKIREERTDEIIKEWKKASATLGKEVRLTIKGCEHTGVARDVTPDGKLVVDCSDGKRREVVSGEVMVRGIFGYV
ncbi:MAG: biotin--[acetyl-CoA-carboxylase] ligase [Clostridia bacterium]|nr:biotin--[acetyl-CoA-carboxylase] ligase [Clostridia bacterium]